MKAATEHQKVHNSKGGAIAIVDAGSHLDILEGFTGTFPMSPEISIDNTRTVAVFAPESENFEKSVDEKGPALISTGHHTERWHSHMLQSSC